MTTPWATCQEIAADVQVHRRTARQVVDQALARADKLQDPWRAFITLTPELARAQAERVDQRLGAAEKLPLAGVPFGVKDLFDVAHVPTTGGSHGFDSRTVSGDAEVVRRLVAAGAVCLGKLNLHECAFGFTGENPHYGDCKNPWNAERITGGSSSGSAVVVAGGICPLSIGSDTGGSIRLPSALCSLVGLKPTYGRVSRRGGIPLSWTMDHVGPMVHTAGDAALVLGVIAGHDEQDESSSRRPVPDYIQKLAAPIRGLRIGIPRAWFFADLEPDVAQGLEQAIGELRELGVVTVDVELPRLDEVVGAHRAIIFAESASYYQPFLEAGAEFGADIRPLLSVGQFLPAVDYLRALRVRRQIREAWSDVFSTVDCLLTPTSPCVATRFGQQAARLDNREKPLLRAFLDLTLPFNLSGHPAVSIPCGFSGDSLPVGMQLVGKPFEEALLLRVAHHYQQVTDWHQRVAPMAR